MSFGRDAADSAYDFDRLVAPELSTYLGGKIARTERVRNDTYRLLDLQGGFDAICKTQGGLLGIASRVQWTDRAHESWTIRLRRDSGADTEFVKRLRALATGAMVPNYTVQAYVTERRVGDLLSIGLIGTETLMRYSEWAIAFGYARFNRATNASFQYVSWVELGAAVYRPGAGWQKQPDPILIPALEDHASWPSHPRYAYDPTGGISDREWWQQGEAG